MRKRPAIPPLREAGQAALDHYAQQLHDVEDLTSTTIRNYVSDLRQFMAWCELVWESGQEQERDFSPAAMTTPLLTRYRAHLQHVTHLRPASVNRALISIKRYCGWCTDQGILIRDPAKVVKLVKPGETTPRHLTDDEESALVAAVGAWGTLRDRTMITLMLHTGLRASEVCHLQWTDVRLGKRSGVLQVLGKRNKLREVPLNSTVRAALAELQPHTDDHGWLFQSEKTGGPLTERAIGYIVARYANLAQVKNLSPHDLRHRFGYRMAEVVPLHRLAQIMGHDSLNTTLIYTKGTAQDLQREVEKIAWQ